MYPVLFRIGPIAVESFWVMVFLGFAAAAVVTRAEFKREGVDPHLTYDLILYAYVGGLLGARLFLLFTDWDLFIADPFTFLFSGSGWVWYGGLIGGALAVTAGSLYHRIPIAVVADAAGPALAIAQAIGRMGCQLAGDGDYGIPTSLPWGMSYPHGVVPTTELVHPTPIYEAILYTAIFFWLWRRRGKMASAEPFAQYLILSGIARFGVEFLRRNPVVAGGLTVAQWISVASVLLGVGLVVAFRRKPAVG